MCTHLIILRRLTNTHYILDNKLLTQKPQSLCKYAKNHAMVIKEVKLKYRIISNKITKSQKNSKTNLKE